MIRRVLVVLAVAVLAVAGVAGPAAADHETCATQYNQPFPNVTGTVTVSHCWYTNTAHTGAEPSRFKLTNNTGGSLTMSRMSHSFYPGGNVTSSNEYQLATVTPPSSYVVPAGSTVTYHWTEVSPYAVFTGCPTFRVNVFETRDVFNARQYVGRVRVNPPPNC